MKNLFQKKIFIVGTSVLSLLLNQCADPGSDSEAKLDPDNHPAISVDYSNGVSYQKSEYPLLEAENILIDSLFIQVAYKLGSKRNLLIARNIEDDVQGLKLLLVDPSDNNKLIYRSSGSYESMTLHPTFFVPNNSSYPTIITCGIGMLESWGQRLFIMKGDTLNDISYLDIAAKIEVDSSFTEKGFELKDIGPYAKVKMDETGIHLSFLTDSLIYYGEKDEITDPILNAKEVEYTLYDGVLRTNWKN